MNPNTKKILETLAFFVACILTIIPIIKYQSLNDNIDIKVVVVLLLLLICVKPIHHAVDKTFGWINNIFIVIMMIIIWFWG